MTIFGLAESFKTINRPGPTVTLFDGLFLGKSRNHHTSHQFVLSKFGIDIFDSLKTIRFSAT